MLMVRSREILLCRLSWWNIFLISINLIALIAKAFSKNLLHTYIHFFCNLVVTFLSLLPPSTTKEMDEKNCRKILNIFQAYLIVNFIMNLILIIFHFNMSSIGNIIFTFISFILPLISVLETFFYYNKCLKFLKDAYKINSILISRRIIIKTLLILSVIFVQVLIIVLRSFFLKNTWVLKLESF